MKNARANILFFIDKYANLWGFCWRRRRGCFSSLTFGAEQLRFEPTTSEELNNGSRLRGRSLNSFGAKTLQGKSKGVTYKELKNPRRMKGAIIFDKPVKVL